MLMLSFNPSLRASEQCLKDLRSEPGLGMPGSPDAFIAKLTLIWGGCPAIGCKGGHRELLDNCVEWWRLQGWKLMNFKGPSNNVTGPVIKEKISMFLRNLRRRQGAKQEKEKETMDGDGCEERQDGNQEANGIESNDEDRGEQSLGEHLALKDLLQHCQFCTHTGPMAQHLQQADSCLKAYIQDYLPSTRNVRQAIFDLGLLLAFCPNPACGSQVYIKNEAQHNLGPCGNFLVREGELLYRWRNATRENLRTKIKSRRWIIKRQINGQKVKGLNSYRRQLQEILIQRCSACDIRGPFLTKKEQEMQIVYIPDRGGAWICAACKKSLGDQNEPHAFHVMKELGGKPAEDDDTLKPVKVDGGEGGGSRIVFVPAPLAANLDIEEEITHLQAPNVTVLVPWKPGAIDDIGDRAFKRALEDKKLLKEWAEYCSKRHFVDVPMVPLTILYRRKLLEIEEERSTVLKQMASTCKGEIISRDLNTANIKERNPHFSVTKSVGLTNRCKWSSGYQENREDESFACSSVEGQVKTKVRMEILQNITDNYPELQRVLIAMLHEFSTNGVMPLLPTAPIVLQHLQGKVKLLIEHIISMTYSDWDLEVKFKQREWSAYIVGFLYSSEYEELNQMIACARGEVNPGVIRRTILLYPEKFPTVSLDVQHICDHYAMQQDEAEVTEVLAKLVFPQLSKTESLSFYKSREGNPKLL